MPRRRALLAEDVRIALERLAGVSDSATAEDLSAPFLPAPVFERLRVLTAIVEEMLEELATGKTLWRFEPTARALSALTVRMERATDAKTARQALEDLLGVLTDETRWR